MLSCSLAEQSYTGSVPNLYELSRLAGSRSFHFRIRPPSDQSLEGRARPWNVLGLLVAHMGRFLVHGGLHDPDPCWCSFDIQLYVTARRLHSDDCQKTIPQSLILWCILYYGSSYPKEKSEPPVEVSQNGKQIVCW